MKEHPDLANLEFETFYQKNKTPIIIPDVPIQFGGIELPLDWAKHQHGNFQELSEQIERTWKKYPVLKKVKYKKPKRNYKQQIVL